MLIEFYRDEKGYRYLLRAHSAHLSVSKVIYLGLNN